LTTKKRKKTLNLLRSRNDPWMQGSRARALIASKPGSQDMTKTSFLSSTVAAIVLAGALVGASAGAPALAHGGGWGHGGFGHHGAWGHRRGWGGGFAYYGDYSYCHLERRFDYYGNYIGRVRVCP
jgi:hypothetical protein